MGSKLVALLVSAVLLAASHHVMAQQQKRMLVVISAPQAVIPQNLQDNDFDNEIKKLRESLPGKLETLIINFSSGKIQFLESELLMELRDVINYEKPRGFIDAISDSLKEKINAVLLTKIEKVGASQITIKAKIVHINRKILSVREKITHLEPQLTFDSNLESLTKEIVNDLVRPPVSDKFIKNPIFWTSVATISSGTWLFIENNNVNNNYNNYKEGSTIEEVTKARIKTEKSETIRAIAFASTIVSAVTLLYLIVKPIFSKKERVEPSHSSFNQEKNVRVSLHPKVYDEGISLSLKIGF